MSHPANYKNNFRREAMGFFNEDNEYYWDNHYEEGLLDSILEEDAKKFNSIYDKRREVERRIAESQYKMKNLGKVGLALQKRIEEAEVRNRYKDLQMQHVKTLK